MQMLSSTELPKTSPPRRIPGSVEGLDGPSGFRCPSRFPPSLAERAREPASVASAGSGRGSEPAAGRGRLRWGSGHRLADAISDFRTLHGRGDSFQDGCLRRWAGRWGFRRLGSVSARDLADYLAELSRADRSPGEIDREKALLGSFYRWALRCGIARVDPTSALGEKRDGAPRRRLAWTAAEERRLLDACRGARWRDVPWTDAPRRDDPRRDDPRRDDPRRDAPRRDDPRLWSDHDGERPPSYLYPLVLLAVRTGLRPRDLVQIEWRHVDLVRRRLRLPPSDRRQGPSDRRQGQSGEVILDAECVCALESLLARATRSYLAPRGVFDAAGIPVVRGRPDERAIQEAIHGVQRRARVPLEDLGA